ncbi:phosphatidylserine decarboxylase [Friedmanniomyces endolithicus]|nr:phosphatidylserine decarboxylase [Friedmanniomyces endolithicus]
MRPKIPHHLSLHRVKSSTSSPPTRDSTEPSTPPGNSRHDIPNRTPAIEKDDMLRKKGKDMAASIPLSEQRGDHKNMALVLRVQVIRGRNLAPKDKSGTSDPYLVLTMGDKREATSIVSKTLNPEWNQTFDFPVLSAESSLIEAVCWDKDRFKKDYMGEFDVMIEDHFAGGSTSPEPRWHKLEGRRSGKKQKKKKDDDVSGEVLLRFRLFNPLDTAATPQQILQRFYGVVAAAGADEDGDDSDDDELLSRLNSHGLDDVSEEEDKERSDETADDEGMRTPGGTMILDSGEKQKRQRRQKLKKLKRKSKLKAYEFSGMTDVAGVLFLEIIRITDLPPERNMTRTSFDMDPFVVTSLGKKTYRTKVVNHNLNPVYDEKLVFQVQKHELNYSLSFAVVDRDKFSGNDFVGTALFPVEKVRSLAPESDPETGLYKLPDPDAVTDSDTRRRKWRVPMSRSGSQNNLSKIQSRNNSQTNLNKLALTTSNTSVSNMAIAADVAPNKPGLARQDSNSSFTERQHRRPPGPTSHPSTSGSSAHGNGSHAGVASTHDHMADGSNDETGLYYYELPLELKNKSRWEEKYHPILYIRVKYLPYDALRQQFWRVMLRQYDADESGKLDKVELVTMLDTLGSTLHNATIDGFFKRFAVENGGEEVLTMDQAIMCLERQLMTSQETHKQLHAPHWLHKRGDFESGAHPKTSTAGVGMSQNSSPEESPGGGTPYLGGADQTTPGNFSTKTNQIPTLEVSDLSDAGERGLRLPDDDLAGSASGIPGNDSQLSLTATTSTGGSPDFSAMGEHDLNDPEDTTKEEHVVEIHECPICHLPRLTRGKRTTDADIITHIATCASSDWRAVNNLVMAGFVTSSQAQRKWYSKVISKVSYGGYKLGANSANILVQDRVTGMINEERMSVYVRLGIRLLYKGFKSRDMEKKKIRKLLRSLSFKQGRKYDDPNSASQIPGFINFHQLNMAEVLLTTPHFKSFNEFFYRKLKPTARPCSAPDNPHIVVSPADARSVVFNRMEDAQRIWVKGREFSIERLLGDAYPADAKRYRNGALGILRLAPQDYHRFHIPVDGVMGEPRLIDGEYYTVNPMAIRSALDVYGENIRVVVPIDSEVHGRVFVVCVGAMMVGSTVITRKAGERVRRAEELGYFKFGGSTLLLLFEPGVVKFDDDLVGNSNAALETLVRVGMSIGHSPDTPQYTSDSKKDNPTQEEMNEGKRRIEGSLAPSTGTQGVDLAMKFG